MSTTNLVNQVSSRKEAQEVVTMLLKKFSSDVAYQSVFVEAAQIKQRPEEVWKRRVTNLFTSLSTRRG